MRLHPRKGLLAAGFAACTALALAGCGDDGRLTAAAGRFDAAGIDPSRFTGGDLRVDRMAMPAVATATITSKDAYNAANPVDDAAGTFVSEIVGNVGAIHAALDDDLTALGLTPCATMTCVNQAAPFVVPDVIRIDPSLPAGFPNGRRLTDPVIDVTLALVLLDLSVHPVNALIGVNPTANDLPFRGRFPYVARPHTS
ncbi:MAG: DUF4331 family protein [Candidatus Eiseniibacteriota bacterium]